MCVTACDINSVDDGICPKPYYPGYCDDSFHIANNTIRSGASAVKFSTTSYGGFKNITVDHIKVFDTYRSAIAIESVDGATVENVRVTNITAKNTGNAIFIHLGNRTGKVTGKISHVYLGNINVQVPFARQDINYDIWAQEPGYHNPFPSSIAGIPGSDVQDIVLENIKIDFLGRASKGQAYFPLNRLKEFLEQISDYLEFSMFGELPAWGFYVRHARGTKMKNITLKLDHDDFRPAIVFDDVKEGDLDRIALRAAYRYNQIVMKGCRDVRLTGMDKLNIRKMK